MKKFVLIGFLVMAMLWLTGCGVGGTYKQIDVEYPPISPYAKYKVLNLEIISPENVDKDDLKSFEELITSAFQKRGISVVNVEKPKLIVEIIKFNKDALSAFVRDWIIGFPFGNKTNNLIDIRVFVQNQTETIEFKEFQEFKESIRNWEDLKRTVANRIADAVYFAH